MPRLLYTLLTVLPALAGCATTAEAPPMPTPTQVVVSTLPPGIPDTSDWVWIELHCTPRFSTVERFSRTNNDNMMEFRVDGVPTGVFYFSYQGAVLSSVIFARFGDEWKAEMPQVIEVGGSIDESALEDEYAVVEVAPGGVWGESRMVLEATRTALGLPHVEALGAIIETCTNIVTKYDY